MNFDPKYWATNKTIRFNLLHDFLSLKVWIKQWMFTDYYATRKYFLIGDWYQLAPLINLANASLSALLILYLTTNQLRISI